MKYLSGTPGWEERSGGTSSAGGMRPRLIQYITRNVQVASPIRQRTGQEAKQDVENCLLRNINSAIRNHEKRVQDVTPIAAPMKTGIVVGEGKAKYSPTIQDKARTMMRGLT